MRKKALLCIFLCIVCVFTAVIPAFAASYYKGDVMTDGQVGADDARLILRFSVGLQTPTELQKLLADVDNNGQIEAADARLALRTSVGLEKNVSADTSSAFLFTDSAQAIAFKTGLYGIAHQNFDSTKGYGVTYDGLNVSRGAFDFVYNSAGKWCCYYTVHAVLRPALESAGYSKARIDELAPIRFDKNKIYKALKNILESAGDEAKVLEKFIISPSLIPSNFPFYIPSVLMDYYQSANANICTTYTLHEYYDDVITNSLITKSSNAGSYTPQVGDIIFMSNKKETYYKGYMTVDHTAQIIDVKPDGTFLCTEGSITLSGEPDSQPRVRERWYKYSENFGTYVYVNNSIVRVLACVRPDY